MLYPRIRATRWVIQRFCPGISSRGGSTRPHTSATPGKKILGKAARGSEIFGGGQRSITAMVFVFLYPQKRRGTRGRLFFPLGAAPVCKKFKLKPFGLRVQNFILVSWKRMLQTATVALSITIKSVPKSNILKLRKEISYQLKDIAVKMKWHNRYAIS